MIERDDATNSIIQSVALKLRQLGLDGGLGDDRHLRDAINQTVGRARDITAENQMRRANLLTQDEIRIVELLRLKRGFDRMLPLLPKDKPAEVNKLAETAKARAAVTIIESITDAAEALFNKDAPNLKFEGYC